MRRALLSILTGLFTGVLVLGVAWATSGLVPVPENDLAAPSTGRVDRDAKARSVPSSSNAEEVAAALEGGRLPAGVFKVGAHDQSIAPIPTWEDGPWNPHQPSDPEHPHDCGPIGYEYLPNSDPSCLRTFDRVWATGYDEELDIAARAIAISNGEDTLVFVVLDTVSWFYGYDPSICPDPDAATPTDTCGTRAITNDLSEELGIPVKNFVIASTHTHASADTTARGPSWYYEFVRDQIKEAVRKSVAKMQVAELRTGAIPAKAFNIDRRIVTRAVPDAELTWLRAVALPPGQDGSGGDPGGVEPGDTIATLVNFSVHPTVTAGNAVMHSGFIGHLSKRMNELWGGSTVFMPGGLGDQTVQRSFGRDGIGYGLAELVYESAQSSSYTLRSNDIVSEQRILQIPADNASLVALNKIGVFMRDSTVPGDHAAGPVQSVQQKGRAQTPSCMGASAISVLSPVGGVRIGTPGIAQGQEGFVPGDRGDALVMMQAPGEIFASISLTTKDYLSRARNVMVFGMANDHIGYIIPAEQYDIRGANAVGIAQPSLEMTNYEESLSTGRCTGDQIQNALVEIGANLNVMGPGEGR